MWLVEATSANWRTRIIMEADSEEEARFHCMLLSKFQFSVVVIAPDGRAFFGPQLGGEKGETVCS